MEGLPNPTFSHADYTIACICPLGVELAAVEGMLDEIHELLPTIRDQNAYTFGRIGAHNLVVAVMPEIGNNAAATVATQLLNDFPFIRFGLLVGIGGGVPGDDDQDADTSIRLGDVVVSQSTDTFGGVVQYDLGKSLAGGGFQRTGHLDKPPPVLSANVRKLQAQHLRLGNQIPVYLSEMIRRYPRMQAKYSFPGNSLDQLFMPSYAHQFGETCSQCDAGQTVSRSHRSDDEPRVHYGTIGSANLVVKDAATRDRLRKDMNLLCVEMEAAGLMNNFPCLFIRGICDYADSHKNKRWQPYAAATAAAYMKELLTVIPARHVAQIQTATLGPYSGGQTSLQYLASSISGQPYMHGRDQQHHSSRLDDAENISSGLHFPEIQRRYENIDDAYPKTFEWILKHPHHEQPLWDSFIDWIGNKAPFYWISGKPGSGKSTLMKYLVRWLNSMKDSEDITPIILSFWFWEAGQELERGLTGCMRSLIWQLLQDKRLKETVLRIIRPLSNATWTNRRLESALTSVLKSIKITPLFVFLDGLDEAGTESDNLLSLLESLSDAIPGLKICISSRPEQIFVDALSCHPKLRMQDLNAGDIDVIINEELLNNRKLYQIIGSADRSNLYRITNSIKNRAEGVVLWVKLVIRNLLRGLRNRDGLDLLLSRLEELPTDLDTLYEFMLRRNNRDIKQYAETAGLYFKVITSFPDVISVPEFCLAVDEDLRAKYLNPETGWDMTDVASDLDCERAITWINVRAAGLLEVKRISSSLQDRERAWDTISFRGSNCPALTRFLDAYEECDVEFIHRTARTYIVDTVSGHKILSACTKTDEECEHMCYEAMLVFQNVFRGLEGSMIGPDQFMLFLDSKGRAWVRRVRSSNFEKIVQGFVDRAHITVETSWAPGMGSQHYGRLPFPSSRDGSVDFCQLYCMFGVWEDAERLLDDPDEPKSADSLSLLLVFVAYALCFFLPAKFSEQSEKSKLFLRLIENGANPNHAIVTPNLETIWLFPYICLWLSDRTNPEMIDAISRSDFGSTPKSIPTMSTCSEIFWDTDTLKKIDDVHLWGDFCVPGLVSTIYEDFTIPVTGFLPSRVYVICEAYPDPSLPVLYPVTSSESEQLITYLEENVRYDELRDSIRVGIIGISQKKGEDTEQINDVLNIKSRSQPFSSLLEAFQFMGKSLESIRRWAIAEEAKLRRRREDEENISRWKSWVFGPNIQCREFSDLSNATSEEGH